MAEEMVLTQVEGPVAIVTLNRPKVLNALNRTLMGQLVETLERQDANPEIRCIIVTGSGEKAFAAGADIAEMAEASVVEMDNRNQFAVWDHIQRIRKPIIAAVNGFCLGGGCELAMRCDIILASETAQFGQPEIKIGIIPGAGGTQRLSAVVGKYRAMELMLTGRRMSAHEAHAIGLVTRVVESPSCMAEAMVLAKEIASQPPLAVRAAKQAVLRACEAPLVDGLDYEQKLFYMLFASEDQKEGMKAFMEKRKPEFTGK